jgi:hypothetical protein
MLADGGSWQGLFESSGERAVSSVASALAAVNDVDVLSNLDLSYTSTSRGRRRIGSNGSSSSTSSMEESVESSSMNGSSSAAVAGVESSTSGDESLSARDESSSCSISSGAAAEVQKGDPEGPPPVLAAGDDDIYWVSKLHDGLISAGFYPADDEVCLGLLFFPTGVEGKGYSHTTAC